MNAPLKGIKVLNCGTAGVGPWAATLLGYLGAEVIKIERPSGEMTRRAFPQRNGVSTAFLALNINQTPLYLDMKDPDNRAQFEQLVAGADVLIENYRPGVAERIGMGYEYVSQINPRLVMASSPGWGHSGPMRDTGAVDPHLQAFSGFAGLNGAEGDDPEMLRYTHIDPNGSVHLAALVMLGLLQRQRTGKGSYVRSSHLAMALFMQSTRIAETLTTGEPVPRLGSACTSSVPNQCFQARDGAWFTVAVESPEQWQGFCAAIERSELAEDERFCTNAARVQNRRALVEDLQRWFAGQPERWWITRLEAYAVPHSRLLEFDDLRYHQQIVENGYLVEVESVAGPLTLGGLPWRFSRTPASIVAAKPAGDASGMVAFTADGEAQPVKGNAASPELPPLDGLRVIDASQGYAGPLVALLLAEAGAEVTKLEPSAGDWTRTLLPTTGEGRSAAFDAMNRNKLCLSVDKLSSADTARLVEQADIVISDDSDLLAALGLDTAVLAEQNPEMIHFELSGFGERGPMAGHPASELGIQGMTGYLSDLGQPGGEPVRVGADITGTCTAALSFLGVTAALYERAESGKGQSIAASMLGAMMCMRTLRWANHCRPDEWKGGDCNGKTDQPWRGYRTRDGVIWPTMVPVRDDQQILEIYRQLGMFDEVCDKDIFMQHGRDTVGLGFNAQAVKPVWDKALGRLPTEQVLRVFNEHRGIAVEFSELHQLVNHPQVQALDILEGDGAGRYVRAPWHTSWQRPPLKQPMGNDQ
ncbi:MAG: CoA transferase [Pseudomonadales bacterium]